MEKKILSINLWYEKYGNKTRAQLKCFRKAEFDTFIATVLVHDKLSLVIYQLTDSNENLIFSKEFSNYSSLFGCLFDYAIQEKFDIIYIRRLMSKLFYAQKYFKSVNKHIPIVYEIPTFPLDTGNGVLYSLRDFLEMTMYKCIDKSIRMTLVNLIADMPLRKNWYKFHNGIDIDNYHPLNYPELTDTIKFLIVANISEYHHYERMIDAMHTYSGDKKIDLTIISPDSNAYEIIKNKVKSLNLSGMVHCLPAMNMSEIEKIAEQSHIGVAQLSTSEKGSNLVNTLKSKDYCAFGLPFFSTCYDTSFEKDFPFAYITESMDEEINLNGIIDWYLNIHSDKNYRQKMFDYARNNLQFDKLVSNIIDTCL